MMESQVDESKATQSFTAKWNAPITIEQIESGIGFCIENSNELFNDAMILFRANRAPRAMSLLMSAIEELGKISVVAAMARIPACNSGMWCDAWADFRTHQNKSTWAMSHTLPDEYRAHPDAFSQLVNLCYNDSGRIEKVRQTGLYVDYFGSDFGWFSPLNIDASRAEDWVAVFLSICERVNAIAMVGLYSKKALAIQHEVYSPLNRNRKRRKKMSDEDWRIVCESFR